MKWNWQNPNWPKFQWDASKLSSMEALFLESSGKTSGATKHLRLADREAITVEFMTNDAMDTSEIEGEILDRDSVQSSIRRGLGLAADTRGTRPAEAGIAEMMVNALKAYSQPLSHDALFAWHGMVTGGRIDLAEIGRYRTHAEPMQVISGTGRRRRVHFEAPPSEQVPEEMKRFIQWFNTGTSTGKIALLPLTRAGIAHLWFESIHPFEDGNGRIGRVLAEKALMQGLESPVITSLSSTLLKYRQEYYKALEAASCELDITPWLLWFSEIALEATKNSLAQVEFLIFKTKYLDSLKGNINSRQEKALLRVFAAGTGGFKGGLSAGNYARITGAASATATRDLTDLVAKNALVKVGEKKATRYYLPTGSYSSPAHIWV